MTYRHARADCRLRQLSGNSFVLVASWPCPRGCHGVSSSAKVQDCHCLTISSARTGVAAKTAIREVCLKVQEHVRTLSGEIRALRDGTVLAVAHQCGCTRRGALSFLPVLLGYVPVPAAGLSHPSQWSFRVV